MKKRTAIFFDRDGIVNKRKVGDYLTSISEFEFLDGFFALFDFAQQNNFLKIIISNQQGVGKGLMSEGDLQSLTAHFQQQLQSRTGTCFDDIFYCTELESSGSARRKPEPGMILEAIEKWNIYPFSSWMIGDSISDVIAGRRAGVKTILVGDFLGVAEADVVVATLDLCLQELKGKI